MKKLLVMATLMLTPLASYAGDPAEGKKKAGTCAACHGAVGVSLIPTYPNLAGQNEGYLALALKSFRDGSRTGGNAAIMGPMAKSLSDEDIENLAAYYASLK